MLKKIGQRKLLAVLFTGLVIAVSACGLKPSGSHLKIAGNTDPPFPGSVMRA